MFFSNILRTYSLKYWESASIWTPTLWREVWKTIIFILRGNLTMSAVVVSSPQLSISIKLTSNLIFLQGFKFLVNNNFKKLWTWIYILFYYNFWMSCPFRSKLLVRKTGLLHRNSEQIISLFLLLDCPAQSCQFWMAGQFP